MIRDSAFLQHTKTGIFCKHQFLLENEKDCLKDVDTDNGRKKGKTLIQTIID
jgi:hypothetical protein